MPDPDPTATDVASVVVTGQRRAPDTSDLWPERPEPIAPPLGDAEAPDVDAPFDPCGSPNTRLAWNTDAAAAKAKQAFIAYKNAHHPEEQNLSEREYGLVLWEMPDGSVVAGPVGEAELRFDQAHLSGDPTHPGRPAVDMDYTPPGPGAVVIGSVHSHNAGSRIPSVTTPGYTGDVGANSHLSGLTGMREAALPGLGFQTRIYILSLVMGPANTSETYSLNVYYQMFLDAVGNNNTPGPEVNPQALDCNGY